MGLIRKEDIHSSCEEYICKLHSNPNLLINGDFQVWQRGTTFNDLSKIDHKYTADRWRTYAYNANSPTISKHEKGWRVQGANGFNLMFSQIIEEAQLKSLYGKALTLSVEYEILKGNITVTAAIRTDSPLYNMGNGVNRIESPNVNQGTNKIGVLKTTLNSFKNGYKTLMAVIYIDNTNMGDSDLIIKNAKLEIGSVATPFISRSFGEELALCQMYYQRLSIQQIPYVTDPNQLEIPIKLHCSMRKSPTLKWGKPGYLHAVNGSDVKTLCSNVDTPEIEPINNGGDYLSEYFLGLIVSLTVTVEGGTLWTLNASPDASNRISSPSFLEADAEIY